MNRALIFTILLLAIPSCALSQLEPDNAPPAVTVYTQFDKPYSAVSLDEMKHELETIMGPLGLDFAWRSLAGARGNEVSAELVVVTFKGTCEMDDELGLGLETGALGWTHMSDGAVLPFSDLDCDKIRRFISPEIRSLDAACREVVYGRALGRVLAHELYHVFTNTTRHASWGVAKALYTAHELVSDHFQFQEKDTTALRGGKLKAVLRGRKPPVLSFSGVGR
jgi:hypothetical protein